MQDQKTSYIDLDLFTFLQGDKNFDFLHIVPLVWVILWIP